MDVADLLQVVRVRVLRLLERRGVLEQADELTLLPDDLSEREPALAQLAAASVSGLLPAGPEQRDRPLQAIRLKGSAGVEMTGPLAAAELGFSLHAATTAEADDEVGRQTLLRYLLRPPIAQNRLKLMPSGLVRIELRRPFTDGTVAVEMDPLSLLCRLAAMVPSPRMHTVRYSGVLAPASKWRPLVVPPPPAHSGDDVATDMSAAATATTTKPAEDRAVAAHPAAATRPSVPTAQAPHPRALADSAVATSSCHSVPGSPCSSAERKPTHRSRWRPWSELLRRTFQQELANCRCGGRMKLRALVTRPKGVRRILRHPRFRGGRLSESPPTRPLALPPARRPTSRPARCAGASAPRPLRWRCSRGNRSPRLRHTDIAAPLRPPPPPRLRIRPRRGLCPRNLASTTTTAPTAPSRQHACFTYGAPQRIARSSGLSPPARGLRSLGCSGLAPTGRSCRLPP